MRLDELVVSRGWPPVEARPVDSSWPVWCWWPGRSATRPGLRCLQTPRSPSRSDPASFPGQGRSWRTRWPSSGSTSTGALALDVGASTGGFVDCLLQSGAEKVIALDVGQGQLDHRLRVDPRVYPLDRVNARYLACEQLPYQPDLLTMDVSFISVSKVLPAVVACMAPAFRGMILVKPQFEAGPSLVGKGGIVRDPEVHRRVLVERGRFVIEELDADLLGICRSGLPGADGNEEFFFHIARGGEKGLGLDTLEPAVHEVLAHAERPRVATVT